MLVFGVVALLTLSAIVRFSNSPALVSLGIERFLDVNGEGNLPATYSGALLLIAAGLLFLVVAVRPPGTVRLQKHWLGLGIIFAVLTIDELAGIHELFNSVGLLLRDLGWDAMYTGVFRWPWVLVGMVFVLGISLAYFRFLRSHSRRTQILFVGAAILFVSGAVGMEMVGAVLTERSEHATNGLLNPKLANHVEEGLEMLGVILFIYALLDYLNPISFSIDTDRHSISLSAGNQD